jgi:hypothetical protein
MEPRISKSTPTRISIDSSLIKAMGQGVFGFLFVASVMLGHNAGWFRPAAAVLTAPARDDSVQKVERTTRAKTINEIQKVAQTLPAHEYRNAPIKNAQYATTIMQNNGMEASVLRVAEVEQVDPLVILTLLTLESGGGQTKYMKTGTSSAIGKLQILLPQIPKFMSAYGKACLPSLDTLENAAVTNNFRAVLAELQKKKKDGTYAAFLNELDGRAKDPTFDPFVVAQEDSLAGQLAQIAMNDTAAILLLNHQYQDEPARLAKRFGDQKADPVVALLFKDSPATLVRAVHHFGLPTCLKFLLLPGGTSIGKILGQNVCTRNKINPHLTKRQFVVGYFAKTQQTAETLGQKIGKDTLKRPQGWAQKVTPSTQQPAPKG